MPFVFHFRLWLLVFFAFVTVLHSNRSVNDGERCFLCGKFVHRYMLTKRALASVRWSDQVRVMSLKVQCRKGNNGGPQPHSSVIWPRKNDRCGSIIHVCSLSCL